MATFEFILLLSIGVLVSAVVSQFVRRVALPLIQIATGFALALLHLSPISPSLEPDFFLLLLIAPLLFHDAKEADRTALWKNRYIILSLAVGLVLVITLSVGAFVHWIIPSIPLALAFALGATLGPTDAVAVSSMSEDAQLSRDDNALLQGEALLNDATGVVAFQFAVAAAVSGGFSVGQAAASFVVLFVGGLAFGTVVALAFHLAERFVRNAGLESTTFHVLFDVLSPFVIYLLAETIHVSGVLAVVASGLVLGSFGGRKIGPTFSRLNIVSGSVWETIVFFINGVVFVMLGFQLPRALQTTWDDVQIANTLLIGWVLAITLIVMLVRFVWVLVTNYRAGRNASRRRVALKQRVKSALITTCGGPKGAVTLAIAFSLPYTVQSGAALPQRDLVIFIASGVILCTLVVANILLPVLAPSPERDDETSYERYAPQRIAVMQVVVSKLNAEVNDDNAAAVQAVVASYLDRIDRIRTRADLDNPVKDPETDKLRLWVNSFQEHYVEELIDADKVDAVTGYRYLQRLSRLEDIISHTHGGMKRLVIRLVRRGKQTLHMLRSMVRRVVVSSDAADRVRMRALQMRTEEATIAQLEGLLGGSEYSLRTVASVLTAHHAMLARLRQGDPTITQQIASRNEGFEEMQRVGLQLELETIQEHLDASLLSRPNAQAMRENVYLMQMDVDGLVSL